MIADIHGEYRKLKSVMDKIDYVEGDTIVFLGDYVDRGIHSYEVLMYLMELDQSEKNVIFLRGNHDEWLLDAFEGRMLNDEYLLHWFKYGGYDTVESMFKGRKLGFDDVKGDSSKLRDVLGENFPDVHKFLKRLDLWHEDDHFYYVHAGVNPFLEKIESNVAKNFYWMDREMFLGHRVELDKPVVFGHTVTETFDTKYLYKSRRVVDARTDGFVVAPYIFDCGTKIGLDCGAVYGNPLVMMVIEDGTGEFSFIDSRD